MCIGGKGADMSGASSPGNGIQCYTEPTVSSPAVAESVASTRCTYDLEGTARLSCLDEYLDGRPAKACHQSTVLTGLCAALLC